MQFITFSHTHARACTHTHTQIGRTTLGKGSAYLNNTQHRRQTFMPPAEFEPAIPASQRPQTLALYHATTAIGPVVVCMKSFCNYPQLASNTAPAACRYLRRVCLFSFRKCCERITVFELNRRQTSSRLCSQNHATLITAFSG